MIARLGLPLVVVVLVVVAVASAAKSPVGLEKPAFRDLISVPTDGTSIAADLDQVFARRWFAAGLRPAERADELVVLRRLSLALTGTVPSLEEIRAFEGLATSDRVDGWVHLLMSDKRFHHYLSTRLSRFLLGAENGQFIVFRRDQFVRWMAEQIKADRPYDETVRAMLAERGLWTSRPAVNFITAAIAEEELYENKLAGRTSRAFLGQRIDCAECHDHPFAEWKQTQFEGLEGFFAGVHRSVVGIQDNPEGKLTIKDRKTQDDRELRAEVPFQSDWLPAEGTLRERLAAWVTSSENRRFDRAIVNRVWGLMFGRPLVTPVDDLPDPPSAVDLDDPLDVLAAGFQANGRRLGWLIRTIASTRVFRLASQHPELDQVETGTKLAEHWAVFPLTRLRPEQMIGSMIQSTNLQTIDLNSHLFVRILRAFRENDFVREYGDLGEAELDEHPGTIPQALLRMNGRFGQELTNIGPFGAVGRISRLAGTPQGRVDAAFLACLTRKPTADESRDLIAALDFTENGRADSVQDLYWMLFNSPEFAWGH